MQEVQLKRNKIFNMIYFDPNESSASSWSFANSRFRYIMNDIIRLSIYNVPAHLASRSSNSRRGLLFSPRSIPSTSPSFSLHHLVISVDLRICVTSEGLFYVLEAIAFLILCDNSCDYSRLSPFIRPFWSFAIYLNLSMRKREKKYF